MTRPTGRTVNFIKDLADQVNRDWRARGSTADAFPGAAQDALLAANLHIEPRVGLFVRLTQPLGLLGYPVDPNDDPLTTVFSIQHPSFRIEARAVWLPSTVIQETFVGALQVLGGTARRTRQPLPQPLLPTTAAGYRTPAFTLVSGATTMLQRGTIVQRMPGDGHDRIVPVTHPYLTVTIAMNFALA